MKKLYIILMLCGISLFCREETFREWKRKRDRLVNQEKNEDMAVTGAAEEFYYAKQDMETAKDRNDYPRYWQLENEYYEDQEHLFDEKEQEERLKEEINDF